MNNHVQLYPKENPAKPKVNLALGIIGVTPEPGQTQRHLETSTPFREHKPPCLSFCSFLGRGGGGDEPKLRVKKSSDPFIFKYGGVIPKIQGSRLIFTALQDQGCQ